MDSGPKFLREKDFFLKMTKEERRKRFVKRKVMYLEDLETWGAYYRKERDRLSQLEKKSYLNKFTIVPSQVDQKLNDTISIWKGDITKIETDAIVNAANKTLLGGLGVDGAIHEAAGHNLFEECKMLLGCETGDAKMTGGYKLPAKYVIHAVGPKGESPDNQKLLDSCYTRSLKLLTNNNLRTIAFPCISTGIYGYPQDAAANVAIKAVRTYLEQNPSKLDRVVFCLFLDTDVEIYETMLQLHFPVE